MDYKPGQQRKATGRPSLLGNGLLERARSTSLALLGLTAAVGLGMIALALNQDWPLIEGAPIPGVVAKRQAVGGSIVAATPKARGEASLRGAFGRRDAAAPAGSERHRAGAAPVVSPSPAPESLVVSDATPTGPPRNGTPGKASPGPAPSEQQPVATPVAAPATPPAPAAPAPTETPAASTSAPAPAPTPSSSPPPPETSEEPVDDEGDEDDPSEESGGYGHDHGYGHGHGHGHWGW